MKHILYIFVIATLLTSCSPQKKDTSITIIETTDIHGTFMPYNLKNDRQSNGSLARSATIIKNKRKDGNVILLDGGDLIQGDPISYYFNFVDTLVPNICSETMNFLKYDAATVGNHDIEAGHNVYDKVNKEFNFPWLAANIIDTKTGEPYFEPYTIINKEGIKIAVLGLCTPGIPKWLPESLWSGMAFEDMTTSSEKWLSIIKKKEKPDLIVGLFHSGSDLYYGGDSTIFMNENVGLYIAKNVSGFNIVFLGHDHQTFNKTVKNIDGKNVLVLNAGGYSHNVAIAQVSLTVNIKNEYDISATGEVINIDKTEIDSAFYKKFLPALTNAKKFVNQRVGEINQTITSPKSIVGPTPFLNIIHKIQLDLSGADISFTAPLSFYSRIDSGEILIRDMFNLYRFENQLYTMSLSGKEIDSYLEYSAAQWFENPEKYGSVVSMQREADGKSKLSRKGKALIKNQIYNFDSGDGIIYTVNPTKPAGDWVDISGFCNGNKFEKDKMYKVALNSYRGNGGGGHLTVGAGLSSEELKNRVLNITDRDIRYYMIEWIKSKGTIIIDTTANWKLVPEKMMEPIKKQDFELIYN